MSSHSELKRIAEMAPTGPWFYENESMYFNDDGYTRHLLDAESGHDVTENDYYAALKFIAAANPVAVLSLIAEVEGLRAQHGRDSAELRSLCQARDDARKDRDQLKAEVARSTEREIMQLAEIEALRKEVASLKPSPIRTDRTTIGYTGCIICGQYTDHGGLQCPNLAARSLSIENQRVMPVEPIRAEHPLDALDRKLKP